MTTGRIVGGIAVALALGAIALLRPNFARLRPASRGGRPGLLEGDRLDNCVGGANAQLPGVGIGKKRRVPCAGSCSGIA